MKKIIAKVLLLLPLVSFASGNDTNKVAVVNSQKIFQAANAQTLEQRTNVSKLINPILKKVALENDISLIIQNPAYTHPDFDITELVIALLENKVQSSRLEKPIGTANIYIVNPTQLLEGTSGKDRINLSNKINESLQKWAMKNKADIILQSAAYVNTRVNITDQIKP